MNRARGWSFAPSALLAVLAGGLLLLAAKSNDAYRMLMQEDGWGEWATAFAFLAAGVLALHAASRPRPRWDRVALGAVGAFCLFVAGEELSWGQRMFGFQPPEIFLQHNYQQESNLHNLLKDVFDSRWQVFLVATAYGVVSPLAARRRWIPPALAPDIWLSPWAGLVAALELTYPFDLTGELCELLLGFVFVADVTLRRADRARAAGGRSGFAVQLAALAAAALAGPALERAVHGPDPTRAAATRGELEQLRGDMQRDGVLQRKLFAKQRVHKRLFTAVREGYLHLGATSAFLGSRPTVAEDAGGGVRDRRGYFLDAWNQPYWMLAESTDRGQGQLLLYSFGPNRRRDTNMTQLESLAASPDAALSGDDIGVLFEIDRTKLP